MNGLSSQVFVSNDEFTIVIVVRLLLNMHVHYIVRIILLVNCYAVIVMKLAVANEYDDIILNVNHTHFLNVRKLAVMKMHMRMIISLSKRYLMDKKSVCIYI